MQQVSEKSKEVFEALRDPEYGNFALVSTEIEGIETDCTSAITREGDEYLITPLAVMVNDVLFPKLANPGGDL